MSRWIARLRRLDRRRIDVVIAVIFVVVNLIVDVSYGFLNPRIRLS